VGHPPVIGNDTVTTAQSNSTNASMFLAFGSVFFHQYHEHPIDYTLKLGALVSPWVEVPEAYEGVKAGIELGHGAFDAARAGREVKTIKYGTDP
jgi:hypothetical protein